MEDAVRETVAEAGWKLRTLQRSARFHTDRELVNLYKARVLSYLEYRTPAVYHATCTVLGPLDRLQDSFLRKAGVTTLEGLMVFNLAPLAARRDMAMLGLIHRTVLGKGPEQFRNFFFPASQRSTSRTRLAERRSEHGSQLTDWRRRTHLNVVRRSALGLVAVYNERTITTCCKAEQRERFPGSARRATERKGDSRVRRLASDLFAKGVACKPSCKKLNLTQCHKTLILFVEKKKCC